VAYPHLLFGSTMAMVRVLEDCARYAPTDDAILVLGPPGSGKTVLARHIHGLSGRSGEFVVCSLANVPEQPTSMSSGWAPMAKIFISSPSEFSDYPDHD